jgi:hypothetical protein
MINVDFSVNQAKANRCLDFYLSSQRNRLTPLLLDGLQARMLWLRADCTSIQQARDNHKISH